MKCNTELNEYVLCNRNLNPNKDRPDIQKYLYFRACIDNDGIRISTGYMSYEYSSCRSHCHNLDFKDGVITFSELLEWYKDMRDAELDIQEANLVRQNLIFTMDQLILKSQKVYAMYKEGLL